MERWTPVFGKDHACSAVQVRRPAMARYRGDVEAVKALVRETEVHRDVYIDEEVFALEMEHVFGNTWVYVGHDSQVANQGDYFGTTIGTQPVLMVRHSDDTV